MSKSLTFCIEAFVFVFLATVLIAAAIPLAIAVVISRTIALLMWFRIQNGRLNSRGWIGGLAWLAIVVTLALLGTRFH